MNSDLIMQILQWLVPSGIAGSLWAWLTPGEQQGTRRQGAERRL